MSNDELLKFLRDTIEIGNYNFELYKQVLGDQKRCYQELIKCKEEIIEQEMMITALAIEVKSM